MSTGAGCFSATAQGLATAQGSHGFAATLGLHGPQAAGFPTAQGLQAPPDAHGLQGFAPTHGLQGLATAQGLHGPAVAPGSAVAPRTSRGTVQLVGAPAAPAAQGLHRFVPSQGANGLDLAAHGLHDLAVAHGLVMT